MCAFMSRRALRWLRLGPCGPRRLALHCRMSKGCARVWRGQVQAVMRTVHSQRATFESPPSPSSPLCPTPDHPPSPPNSLHASEGAPAVWWRVAAPARLPSSSCVVVTAHDERNPPDGVHVGLRAAARQVGSHSRPKAREIRRERKKAVMGAGPDPRACPLRPLGMSVLRVLTCGELSRSPALSPALRRAPSLLVACGSGTRPPFAPLPLPWRAPRPSSGRTNEQNNWERCKMGR
mmetsp:Transcript_63009/g.149277  ORF Transcript_63009/g.149277 Transcript_63009/m.149277 type:complete len:235 (-) Transcript_63009:325-1029(-)